MHYVVSIGFVEGIWLLGEAETSVPIFVHQGLLVVSCGGSGVSPGEL